MGIHAINVRTDGTQVTSAASSATVAIPTDAAGNTARYVRVAVFSGSAYVLPGFSGTTATTGSILVQNNDSVILNVRGCTHIAYLQGAAAEKITITPLDDA
jgi:hypothetical protein